MKLIILALVLALAVPALVLAVLALVLAVLELVLAVLALVMIILVQIIDSALPFQWTAFSDNRVFYRVGPVLIQGRRGDNKGNAN